MLAGGWEEVGCPINILNLKCVILRLNFGLEGLFLGEVRALLGVLAYLKRNGKLFESLSYSIGVMKLCSACD